MDILLISSGSLTLLLSLLVYRLGKKASLWSILLPFVVMLTGLLTIVIAFVIGIGQGAGIALGIIGGSIFFSSFVPFIIGVGVFLSGSSYDR
ncbi:hypothetical protein [Pontibacillus salipaludis]|uniref:hypothetical protein n=1 Tax=Pontibacillus salipaludis TaxID=1697394 RepID=UPI0031E97036